MTVKNMPSKVRINNIDTIVELDETETLTNKTLTAPIVNQAVLTMPVEQLTYSEGTGTPLIAQPILVTTATAYYFNPATGKSATWVPTFTGLGTLLNVNGKTVTVTIIANIASSGGFAATVNLTGTAITPKWQGGVVPSSANTSAGTDVYTYTIVRTAADTYTVFASRTRFA